MAFIKVDLKKISSWLSTWKTSAKVVLCAWIHAATKKHHVTGLHQGLKFPRDAGNQVFTNKQVTHGVLMLASSDHQQTNDRITTLYQKHWNDEVFHLCPMGKNPLNPTPAWRTHQPAR
jgi:hypothetical protein